VPPRHGSVSHTAAPPLGSNAGEHAHSRVDLSPLS
jgi:hypothetical protein